MKKWWNRSLHLREILHHPHIHNKGLKKPSLSFMGDLQLPNLHWDLGVSQNRGKNPKMDGENNGKPYFLMDDLGGTILFGNTHFSLFWTSVAVRFLTSNTCQQSHCCIHRLRILIGLKRKRQVIQAAVTELYPQTLEVTNNPVIWRILGLFSSPISREIDHTQLLSSPNITA